MTSGSIGFELTKACSFWPVLNIARKLSVSWSIFCFCYRHKFWNNPELQRTFCFSFYLFLSCHYSCFFNLTGLDSLHSYYYDLFVFFPALFRLIYKYLCWVINVDLTPWKWRWRAFAEQHVRQTLSLLIKLLSRNQSNQQYITSTAEERKSMELNCWGLLPAVSSRIKDKKPFGVWDINEASATSSIL